MAGAPIVYQGATKIVHVRTNIDMTTFPEIEVVIDTDTQIRKTLTGGGITNVTSTQFDVKIEPADTENVCPGPYKYQARGTDSSGDKIQGRFFPNKIKIKDSAFVRRSANSYG